MVHSIKSSTKSVVASFATSMYKNCPAAASSLKYRLSRSSTFLFEASMEHAVYSVLTWLCGLKKFTTTASLSHSEPVLLHCSIFHRLNHTSVLPSREHNADTHEHPLASANLLPRILHSRISLCQCHHFFSSLPIGKSTMSQDYAILDGSCSGKAPRPNLVNGARTGHDMILALALRCGIQDTLNPCTDQQSVLFMDFNRKHQGRSHCRANAMDRTGGLRRALTN